MIFGALVCSVNNARGNADNRSKVAASFAISRHIAAQRNAYRFVIRDIAPVGWWQCSPPPGISVPDEMPIWRGWLSDFGRRLIAPMVCDIGIVAHPERVLTATLYADEYFNIDFGDRPAWVNPFEP